MMIKTLTSLLTGEVKYSQFVNDEFSALLYTEQVLLDTGMINERYVTAKVSAICTIPVIVKDSYGMAILSDLVAKYPVRNQPKIYRIKNNTGVVSLTGDRNSLSRVVTNLNVHLSIMHADAMNSVAFNVAQEYPDMATDGTYQSYVKYQQKMPRGFHIRSVYDKEALVTLLWSFIPNWNGQVNKFPKLRRITVDSAWAPYSDAKVAFQLIQPKVVRWVANAKSKHVVLTFADKSLFVDQNTPQDELGLLKEAWLTAWKRYQTADQMTAMKQLTC